ncbi:MAG TPA: hypothetical protein VII73_04955 [Caulobacteraceae bacterium]
MSGFRSVSLAVLIGLGAAACAVPAATSAQTLLSVRVGFAPPPLPIYIQPPIPGYGYIWTPGFWAWNGYDYYWVPGTWVEPPEFGYLWTPAWWGWDNGFYGFHNGYWGPHVGFYGGIAYGFGYTGFGYEGGYWHGRNFYYNRSVNNITNVNITNIYNKQVVRSVSNVSYNGGAGGVAARPTSQQAAFSRESHIAPTSVQMRHQQLAGANHSLLASVNHGRPPIAATARPGVLRGPGAVAAQNPASNRGRGSARQAASGSGAGPGKVRMTATSNAPGGYQRAARGPANYRQNLAKSTSGPATRSRPSGAANYQARVSHAATRAAAFNGGQPFRPRNFGGGAPGPMHQAGMGPRPQMQMRSPPVQRAPQARAPQARAPQGRGPQGEKR